MGDSQTGYTSTFHGFYTPLKIVHSLLGKIEVDDIHAEPLMVGLGLGGQERKNFVPVDWVSSVIVYLLTHPEHHGKTYHLTPRHAVPVSIVCEVMEKVARGYAKQLNATETDLEAFFGSVDVFRTQMDVYKAYFRGDPQFDASNTTGAAPHLPCPDIDAQMLSRLSRYALEANFGWPRPQPIKAEFDVAQHLQGLIESAQRTAGLTGTQARLGLQVNGAGGGQWAFLLEDDLPIAAEEGLPCQDVATLYMNSRTFQQLVNRTLSVAQAIDGGQILTEGDVGETGRVAAILQAAAAKNDRSEQVGPMMSTPMRSGN